MSKPKRKKAYNPNKLKQRKIHTLVMHWESQEKARRVDLWRMLNNKENHEIIPFSMYLEMFEGDLAIAIRKSLIPEKQTFSIHCDIHAVNDQSGEAVDIAYDTTIDQPMTIWQFLEGEDERWPDEKIYYMQNGLKVRWQGFNIELERYLATVGDDDYQMVTNHCTLTCRTAFNNLEDEIFLRSVKLTHLRGLGVGL